MRKVFLTVAAIAALTMSSCGNKTEATPNAGDSTVVADSSAVGEASEEASSMTAQLADKLKLNDANGLVTLLQTAQAKVAEIATKNPEQAKEYFAKIQEWVKGNTESIKAMGEKVNNPAISKVLDGVVTSITAANPDTFVETVANAVKDVDPSKMVEQGAEKAQEKVNEVGEAASEKANEAANAAADKAKDAVKGLGL